MTRGNIFGSWGKPTKQPKPEKPKNGLNAAGTREKAIDALRQKVCLTLTYERLPRMVEVHTVGVTLAGRPAMSCYQVGGQSNNTSTKKWRTLCFDECFDVSLTKHQSSAPRPDYKKGAKNFKRIDAEV